ncbi:MAG: SMC-Scp complex subunit ScpB [Candidatus Cryosericum sp.]
MTERLESQDFVSGLELQAAKQQLEAILFAAGEPVGVRYLARRTGQSCSSTRHLLESLQADYASRGVRLVQDGQKYCFSIPEKLSLEPTQPKPKVGLSPQALEILALIITKGPLTRKEILGLRGVTSDKALVSLVGRRLLAAQRDYLKRGMVYDVSDELLSRWGFTSREELLQEIESRRRGL